MNFTIGHTADDPRTVSKHYSVSASFSGTLKNDCSTSEPHIIVEKNVASIATCNYMFIPSFSAYYYVTKKISLSNDLCEIVGVKDVLMSNKDGILSSNAIAKRSQSNYNLYLEDSNFRLFSNPKVITHKFPNAIPCSAAKSCFLLMCTGGAVT